jgi:hypothetical protein
MLTVKAISPGATIPSPELLSPGRLLQDRP